MSGSYLRQYIKTMFNCASIFLTTFSFYYTRPELLISDLKIYC